MTNALSRELVVQAPSFDDLEGVSRLMTTCDIAEFGISDSAPEDLLAEWKAPDLNLERDAWVVTAPDGQLAGYARVFKLVPERLYLDARVHPDYYGRGIGTHLIRLGEARARQQAAAAPPGLRVILFNQISSANDAAREIVEREGFSLARHFWRMQIDMDAAPPANQWPDAISVRTFAPGQDDRPTFEAMEEAFQDHWGHVPWPYESWRQLNVEREDFDRGLWFLAVDGDQIAGGSLCYNFPEEGWVNQLAVRRRWRRQGLGLALLQHTFREFYQRDQRRVSLQVDTKNTSGATRLYQRAGMHVALQFDNYQKVLRPGKETITAQEPVS
jgi:mycothiol synthase